ncbi:M20/M25/M40 family metallo-hydrolase [Sphingomonas sp. LY160]|uniref:M20/M25/M40 family metallo-hydrolase n=1 Tax=Sphingomonas sp. LY160 TaxID=3095342 RepID=UPI002ADEA770|nr:M20/M25/M40 family metallo-hydrolase [Sphingomonas sp. LY160]MEA1071888.1 M20/M25/M40 family metallo-hydrolase [Sphingomonas sp. LY160]
MTMTDILARPIGLLLAATALIAAAPPAKHPISAERLSADVKILASDEFQGRAPGTPGEAKTVEWLVARLKSLGLEPAAPGGTWTQAVPLIRTQLGAGTTAVVTPKGSRPLVMGRDIYASTIRAADRVAIASAPMVFVGYGVDAPERNWDDFKGVDLKGKIAVMLVNDPDFEAAAGDDSKGKFGDRRMTFYGRWVYKYEEAARRGAIGALIVHDTPGAGYGWDTVTAPRSENYDIDGATGRLALQGWLHGDAATALFADAGQDLAALRRASRRSDFKPVDLGSRFSANLPVTLTRVQSQNVLARLSGAKRPKEAVMFGAHWDAYGVGAADARGKTIRPGANDDALGVAGMLEIARVMKAGPRPDRSILFGFWTAEERGLLGSEAYALKPSVPARDTVANITLDILNTGGPSRDVMLVGAGQNSLEADLGVAAKAQGRVVTPEALPERGLFYRADHFSLAKRGVPTLLLMAISGAPDLIKGGRPAGQAWLDGYMKCYHQTCDEWSPALDFNGAADDVALALEVGRRAAKAGVWPSWSDESEFKTVRARDRGRK